MTEREGTNGSSREEDPGHVALDRDGIGTERWYANTLAQRESMGAAEVALFDELRSRATGHGDAREAG